MLENNELKRTLTTRNLIIFGMMTMSPLAPFQVYGVVAQASFGMVTLAYFIGALLMFFTALSYARFSREFPYAGSVYTYVSRGLNPHVGFIAGWVLLSDYILAPALLCLFSSMWLSGLFPGINMTLVALTLIVIVTLINILGVEINARVNTFLFVVQIIALAIFLGFIVKFVFIDGQGFGGFSLVPLFQAEHVDLTFIATATSMLLLGFMGFDGISTLAEETKEPRKMVGRATILALVSSASLFFIQTYLASLAHKNYMDLDPDMALFDIAKTVGGHWFYVSMIIVNVLAVGVAVTLNIQSSVSRVLYSMGRDNVLFGGKFLSKIHPRFRTPINALLFSLVVSSLVILLVDLNTVIMLINFGAVTAFAGLNLSLIAYFFIKKKERSGKNVLFHLVFPLIGFLVCAFVWSGFDTTTKIVGLSWIGVGIILGAIKTKGYTKNPLEIKDL